MTNAKNIVRMLEYHSNILLSLVQLFELCKSTWVACDVKLRSFCFQ